MWFDQYQYSHEHLVMISICNIFLSKYTLFHLCQLAIFSVLLHFEAVATIIQHLAQVLSKQCSVKTQTRALENAHSAGQLSALSVSGVCLVFFTAFLHSGNTLRMLQHALQTLFDFFTDGKCGFVLSSL